MRVVALVLLLAIDGLVVYLAARLQSRMLEATASNAGNFWLRVRAYLGAVFFASIVVIAAIFPFLANGYVAALNPSRDTIGMLFIVGAVIVFVAGALGLNLFARR